MATSRETGVIEQALGRLGLRLIGVTIAAADRLEAESPVIRVRARLLLGIVSAIGWTIDRLPLPRGPQAPRREWDRTGVQGEVWPQPRAEG